MWSAHLLLHRQLVLVIIVTTAAALIFYPFSLESLICWEVSVIIHSRGHAMQLQSNTGRTGPGVCGCRVAFDLSSPTSFTCSHHYQVSITRSQGIRSIAHTLQSLVAIVLIDKYII